MTIAKVKTQLSPVFKTTKLTLVTIIGVVLALTACQSSVPSTNDAIPPMTDNSSVNDSNSGSTNNAQPNPPATTENVKQTKQEQITKQANDIRQALLSKNYQAITPHIHPTKGVRFSMYAYIQPSKDKVFSRQQFTQYLKESRVKFTWGEKDGTGDLHITPLPDYLDNWVADGMDQVDSDSISYNAFQGSGNSLNNLKEKYPKGDFVEFYAAGTEEYSGMDWRSMRLVFEEYQGQYYLVAIVNDRWTI